MENFIKDTMGQFTNCPRCFKWKGWANTAKRTYASVLCPHLFGKQYKCGCGVIFALTIRFLTDKPVID